LPTHADGVPRAGISATVAGGPSISTVGTVTGSGGFFLGDFWQNSSVSVPYADGNATVSGSTSMTRTDGCEFSESPDSGGKAFSGRNGYGPDPEGIRIAESSTLNRHWHFQNS
jgi:hypothetical protein